MGTINALESYLARVYRGMELRAGLAFEQPGVRLNLWPYRDEGRTAPNMHNSAFRKAVYDRALAIFQAAHSPHDEIFLAVDTWRYVGGGIGRRTGLRVLGHYLKDRRSLFATGYKEMPYLYADTAEEASTVRTCRFCVRCQVRDVRVRNLLIAIANQDFPPLRPRVHEDCFFVNTTKGAVFHMYDDRGVDVIFANPVVREHIESQFEAWLLT